MQDSEDSPWETRGHWRYAVTGGMGADSSAIVLDKVIAGLKKIIPGLPNS